MARVMRSCSGLGRVPNAFSRCPAGWRTLRLAALALVSLVTPVAAAFQAGGDTPAGPASISGQAQGEITLEVERFGMGEVARPGEIAAVRVRALDGGTKPREVLLRLEGQDPDGDTPLYEIQMVLNPGTLQGVWMYPLIPRHFETSDALTVSAYEVIDEVGEGAKTGTGSARGRVGQLLGRAQGRMKSRLPPFDAAIAIISTSNNSYGLGEYALTDSMGSWSASGHEVIRTIEGLRTAELPDRWMGYNGLEAVVWGVGDPLEIRGDRAAAIREWVRRGGHLVIIMPVAGQSWTNASANELYDLLPNVTIARREGVDLAAYGAMLTRKASPRFPKDSVVYEFTPVADAKPGEAMPILSGPGGQVVVVRRLYGTGAVTLIGLDLNSQLIAGQGLINADVFWNRVLGRRGVVRSQAELAAAGQQFALSRQDRLFESDIPAAIAKSGKSAAGLLLALIIFVLYWVVAGPGGYAVLRKTGLGRHAWVAFFAAAGVFTAIAWGGAMLLRPGKVEVNHLTILDHVYGQPVQRARSWMSVLIPWYGEARLEVGDAPQLTDPAMRGGGDVLTAWTSPDQARADQGMFPDARGYPIDTRLPRAMTIPTRSTVKQVRADWSGGPAWKMPTPVLEGPEADGEPRLVDVRKAAGKLIHELPGALRGVVIFVVRPQKALSIPLRNSMIAPAYAYRLDSNSAWEPGQILDLAQVTAGATSLATDAAAESYFDQLLNQGSTQDYTTTSGQGRVDGGAGQRLIGLGFFSQFRPPEYSNTVSSETLPVARRTETHGWDMGRWFTQPCIIIMGVLGSDDEPEKSPIPMRIDGEPISPVGRTLVRWVYPLAPETPAFKVEEEPLTPPLGSGAAPTGEAREQPAR